MYVCCECGSIFENLVIVKEDRGECFGFPAYEEVCVSPCCYGDYAETFQCDCCGEWIIGKYVYIDSGPTFCENCYRICEIGDD